MAHRVARALAAADRATFAEDPARYRRLAIAALKPLTVPTAAMIDAAHAVVWFDDAWAIDNRRDFRRAVRAMVTHANTEGEGTEGWKRCSRGRDHKRRHRAASLRRGAAPAPRDSRPRPAGKFGMSRRRAHSRCGRTVHRQASAVPSFVASAIRTLPPGWPWLVRGRHPVSGAAAGPRVPAARRHTAAKPRRDHTRRPAATRLSTALPRRPDSPAWPVSQPLNTPCGDTIAFQPEKSLAFRGAFS